MSGPTLILLLLFLGIGNLAVVAFAQALEYGEACNITTGCSSKEIRNPLQCGPLGKCECDSGLHYNQAQSRCVSPPNGLCTSYSRDGLPIRTCTDFATCWPTDKNEPTSPRQNGTCFCEPDAKEDPHTGLCKLNHGSTRCTKLDDCDVNSLVGCRFGSCQCQDESYQSYNKSSGRCESLVGGACGPQPDASRLPFPAADCAGPNMACEGGKCVCADGYGRTVDRRCIQLTEQTNICQGFGYPFGAGGAAAAGAGFGGGAMGGGGGESGDQGMPSGMGVTAEKSGY